MALLSKQVIGVDIGHSSVKVVGLQLGKTPKFIGCKEITMDPKYLQKEGFDNPTLIGQALREAMHTAAPKALPVASLAYSSISESLAFRKVLELPVMPESQLANSVRAEIGQYLPEAPESMEIDFQVLGAAEGANLQRIMVVAVKKKIVEEYLAVFQAAGIPIKAIDIKPAALGRALVPQTEKDPVIIVDIGSEITTISLYEQLAIQVTGSLNMGGNVIKDPTTGEIDEDKSAERIKRLVSGINDELEHVIKFYNNRTAGNKEIKQVKVSGGGSMIVGMIEALAKESDLEVTAGAPVIALPAFCDRRFYGALGSGLYPLYEQL